jgi:hypothetical protein
VTLSALAIAVALTASPSLPPISSATQSATQAAPAPSVAGQPAAPSGLPITSVIDWLKGQGLAVGPLSDGPNPYVQVQESEHLSWTLTFNACQAQICGDLQFATGFTNPQITPELVNRWNVERRFLKAFYQPPAGDRPDGAALVQYDVILLQDAQVSQLTDHLAVWREMLPLFALHVGYFVQEGAAPPAP